VIRGLPTDHRPLRTAEPAGAEPPMPLAGREGELAAQAEEAVREFRTSIEQTVAASLRGVPGIDEDFDVARLIREAQQQPRPPTRWPAFWRRRRG
jgi:hypothetical protein